MGIVRQLQHWLSGSGPRLQVRDFVPDDHYLRLWADTFPWAQMVERVDQHMATHFPKETQRGRWSVSTRVLLALELLKAELACSDKELTWQEIEILHRLGESMNVGKELVTTALVRAAAMTDVTVALD